MKLDTAHPMNRLAIEYFRHREDRTPAPSPLAPPNEHPDPYMGAGSHPDIVERIWDILGASLPQDCRVLVYGTPALVHPAAGIVIALAYGTQYAIRVPDACVDEAVRAGCHLEQRWSGGATTNTEQVLGRGWVFGRWLDAEKQWLAETYRDLASPA